MDIFQAQSSDFIKNTHRIYFDKEHASELVLHVL